MGARNRSATLGRTVVATVCKGGLVAFLQDRVQRMGCS
jgi:hypothetical protein